jgi:hypothetical protein
MENKITKKIFKDDIANLPIDVLVYMFINDYDKFTIMMPHIKKRVLKLLYEEVKYLDPSSY